MADRYASLRQGLVGCWIPSVSGSGLLLPDLSGRGNNGSLVGMDASDWVSSQYGKALDFDGSNDYVETSQNVTLQQQCSVAMWLMPRSVSATGVLAELTTNYNFNNGLFITQETYGFAVFLSTYTGQFLYNGTTYNYTIQSGKPTHLVALFDRTLGGALGATKLYIDGVLQVGSQPNTNAMTGNFTAAKMFFGARSGAIGPLNGVIDDIRAYSRTLTDSEIRLLASRPGIGLRQESHRNTFYQFPSGARRKRILTGMP